MLSKSNITVILAFASLSTAVPSQKVSVRTDFTPSLTTQLRLADTAIDKYQLLPDDKDFVFDLGNSSIPLVNRKNFPALVGSGMSFAAAEFDACGMAALHIHPRATEIFLVVKGRVLTETVLETGVTAQDSDPTNPLKPRLIKNELTENQATVFPQGSFHTQMNPECTPGYAIAAFSSEDPGAALAAPQTFALTDDFVIANFGGAVDEAEIQRIRDGIPKGALAEVEACKKRCGL